MLKYIKQAIVYEIVPAAKSDVAEARQFYCVSQSKFRDVRREQGSDKNDYLLVINLLFVNR